MTIGIDTRMCGTKHAGIGRYIKELSTNLLKIDDRNQYIFLRPPYRWYSLKEQILMPGCIKKNKIGLMHFPHFNVPLAYNGPLVVTIHDLIIHHFPDARATTLPPWFYRIKLLAYKQVIKHAVKAARAIIVPSEFVKKDILRFYNVDDEKIKVVYEGVDIKFRYQITNVKSISNNKCQISGDYLLYVGSAYPHKNLERLVGAFAILRQKYKFEGQLVLAGKIDYFYNQLQKYIISQYPNIQYLLSNIHFYGHATDRELTQLYSNAKLFIFPSLSEGFGLPPLEAMSFGTPVVASNSTSIPEICEDAALYFNPNDANDIAVKIYSAYTNEKLQNKLRQKGLSQIKKYSWEKMAQETLRIYNNMI
jgi:glycosyltransferase involved in cell wall biosynthesis